MNRTLKPITWLAFVLILASVTACKEEEGNDDELLLLALGVVALTPRNPGSCSFTFGSSSVPIQEYSLAASSTLSFPNSFTSLFKSWAAIKVPNVATNEDLVFNYNPFYRSSTYGDIYLVYEASGCPINSSSTTDWNRTSDLSAARTPTNYTVSGNTITFNGTANGKSFVVVSANNVISGTESVTRQP